MKKALCLLVAFMFLQAETWALSGGPVFVTNGNTDLIGSYSGVMVAKSLRGRVPDGTSLGSSTGIFNIEVPVRGVVTGNVFIFQDNETYNALFNGTADNKKREITGILNGNTGQNASQEQLEVALAIAVPLYVIGTLQAEVSRRFVTNAGNAGANGVSRNAPATIGGRDAAGNSRSLGEFGDTLSGTSVVDVMFRNPAVLGGPTVRTSTKYSVSGVRKTNVIPP